MDKYKSISAPNVKRARALRLCMKQEYKWCMKIESHFCFRLIFILYGWNNLIVLIFQAERQAIDIIKPCLSRKTKAEFSLGDTSDTKQTVIFNALIWWKKYFYDKNILRPISNPKTKNRVYVFMIFFAYNTTTVYNKWPKFINSTLWELLNNKTRVQIVVMVKKR